MSRKCEQCRFFQTPFKVGAVERTCEFYGVQATDSICGDFKSLEDKISLDRVQVTKTSSSNESVEVDEFQERALEDGIFDTVHHIFKIQKVTDKVLSEFEDTLIKMEVDLPMDKTSVLKVSSKMAELYLTYQYALSFGFVGEHLNSIVNTTVTRVFGPKTVNETIFKLPSKSAKK